MKYLVILLTGIALLFCCNSDYKPDYDKGFCEVELNGEMVKFEVNLLEIIEDEIFVSFVKKNYQGFNRISLVFNTIKRQEGIFPLSNLNIIESDSIETALFILASDGDAIEDFYNVKEDIERSSVEITSLTSTMIWGTFLAEFNLAGNAGNIDNPAVYSLSNGRFSFVLP